MKTNFSPGPAVEVRPDDVGGIDEIVVRKASFVLERMTETDWHLFIEDSEGCDWIFCLALYKGENVWRLMERNKREQPRPRKKRK